MKILKDLIKKADDTLDEIEWYAEKAHHLRTENKPLADTFVKIAEMHIDIYGMLHSRMVALINEQKEKGVAVIFVGEDLDVLTELCDRILVISSGRITGIVDGREATKEQLGYLMTQGKGGNA
jgi:ABC-type Na+ transport system ATPase subunit NatA